MFTFITEACLEEFRKQLVLLCIFIVILGIFVIVYKSDLFWNFTKGLPLHTNSQNCTKLHGGVCLAEDAGLRVNYYEASSLCRKRGMLLPTMDEAWQIWIDSENCHRAFASNSEIPKNKSAFIKACNDDNCKDFAANIEKYCTQSPLIKFPRASQYSGGFFWLKDRAGEDKHYSMNYSTGEVKATKDLTGSLGVRCVKPNKK